VTSGAAANRAARRIRLMERVLGKSMAFPRGSTPIGRLIVSHASPVSRVSHVFLPSAPPW